MKDPQEVRIKKTRQLIERGLRKRFDNESLSNVLHQMKYVQNEELLDKILIDYLAYFPLHVIQEKIANEILSFLDISKLEITNAEKITDPYFGDVERFRIEMQEDLKGKLVVRKVPREGYLFSDDKYGFYLDGTQNKATVKHSKRIAQKVKEFLTRKHPKNRLEYLILFDDLYEN